MSTSIQESQQLLARMNRAEKAQLLQWLVQDLGDTFPGIDQQPGVAGGDACVVRTRIPVWLLEQARRSGSTDASLLQAQDLANAWAYVRAHAEEIDGAIRANDDA